MAGKTLLKNAIVIVVLFLLTAVSTTVHAKIIYVDDDGPADFNNIQVAIDNSIDGDIIIVSPGTYTGDGNRNIDFLGKAITVRSTDPNDPNIVDLTIIDCNHLGRGFFFHSGEDGNSILSGFTITNGQAAIGGGICCESQSGPTIANCVISRNTADDRESGGFGGGISGCNGKISNCTIISNTAGGISNGFGGGLYDCNGTIISCTISNNRIRSSGNGGGLGECNADIINCTISNNLLIDGSWGSMGRGGGLYRCNGKIIDSTISGNVVVAEAQAFGGGLYGCNGPIINCIISGNGAHSEILDAYGGGLDNCDGKIINCTIRSNTAAGGSASDDSCRGLGGGLYGCDGTIANCTISNNRAEGSWGWDSEYNWGLGGGLCGCNGTIIDCTISGNTATVLGDSYYSGGAGGGLYGCDGTITNCKIIGNAAMDASWYVQHDFGGGLRECDGTITDYTVIGNTASDTRGSEQRAFGGGLYSCDGTVSNCTISGNIALSEYDCYGGGLYACDGTISNCTISGNTATVTGEPAESDAIGGGLYRCDGTIKNCTISENLAQDLGGGLCACGGSIIDCLITANRAGYGGGLEGCSSSFISNCIISNNWADIAGGGISDEWSSKATVTNCIFNANCAPKGGGVYTHGSETVLAHCSFVSNEGIHGGAMYNYCSDPTVRNCLFTGNWARHGGAIYNEEESEPILVNCTFSGNAAPYDPNNETGGEGGAICSWGGCRPTLTNCILWGDSPDEISGDRALASYCCIQGWTGGIGGIGNIDADPLFIDPGYWDANGTWLNGDYRLTEDSPCIDAGDPNCVPESNEMDLDGRLRIIGCRIDMGAYEYGQIVPAGARIIPRTINLSKKEKWITAYLRLPEEYNVSEIDFCILLLENEIEPELCWFNEQQQVAIARFNRVHLQGILCVGEIELTITAQFTNATCFQGTDVIKVIYEGGKKLVVLDKATNPNPADGATDVNLIAVLSWTADSSAKSHDVYFGTNSSPPFICNQNAATFDPGMMVYDTTYFWRIDEVNKLSKTTGDLWCFTTLMAPPQPPPPLLKASEPNPADGAIGVALTAYLSWKPGHDAKSHDVYFGTTSPPSFVCNQTLTTFDPGKMAYNTTYYWRIDEVNDLDVTTGDIWSFATLMFPPPP